ncbi:zinc-binding dehydrogenase [Streptomyces flavochromogenes]|uniref:Zinc-binding dehydrogenase n=1 Tax=Streptomyces flavochromogenes TaxID=68199 RepID=A0ABW6XQY8_9ACTN
MSTSRPPPIRRRRARQPQRPCTSSARDPGGVVLVHGASGAVGVSLLQQAAAMGATVIGTASEENAALLARFGAEHVAYGDGPADRVRALAPEGITAAVDCAGTDEAVDTSVELLGGRTAS